MPDPDGVLMGIGRKARHTRGEGLTDELSENIRKIEITTNNLGNVEASHAALWTMCFDITKRFILKTVIIPLLKLDNLFPLAADQYPYPFLTNP